MLQHALQADRRAPRHRSSSALVPLDRRLLFTLNHSTLSHSSTCGLAECRCHGLPGCTELHGVCKAWHCLYHPSRCYKPGWEAAPRCTPAVSTTRSQHQPGASASWLMHDSWLMRCPGLPASKFMNSGGQSCYDNGLLADNAGAGRGWAAMLLALQGRSGGSRLGTRLDRLVIPY